MMLRKKKKKKYQSYVHVHRNQGKPAENSHVVHYKKV